MGFLPRSVLFRVTKLAPIPNSCLSWGSFEIINGAIMERHGNGDGLNQRDIPLAENNFNKSCELYGDQSRSQGSKNCMLPGRAVQKAQSASSNFSTKNSTVLSLWSLKEIVSIPRLDTVNLQLVCGLYAVEETVSDHNKQ
ncbi:hypothetical protein Tco_1293755 [Tanacetum coccineum]